MAEIAAGTRVGPYEIVDFIAAGGMGEVYRGRDTRLGRSVAIKILPESAFRDEESIRRFDREARAAAAVSHPNLVSIYDVGEAGEVRYIVMDFLEGATLRQRLAGGPLPWQEAVDITVAITEGISAMHAKGFVHRDLKPENIIITAEGWVKLLDFGLAVSRLPVSSDANSPTAEVLTHKGSMIGTVAYMSPEQVRERELDARADLYSLGCVLYEMLSGRPFIETTTFADMIATILTRRWIELPAHVPHELAQVVRKCLEREPSQRFASALELRSALRALWTAGAPAPALPSEGSPSIAVLPFANLTLDKENEYFSEGLSEEILNALSRVQGLRVTARTSAFAFRGRHEDVRRIGEALGVATILEGGVRRDGNRVRVTAQLVDAASGYHLWSARYDRDMTDVFAVQDEISSAIVETLHLKLLPPAKSATPNLDAYHAYLKSRYHFAKLTPQRFLLSHALAEEAIRLDPNYPPALAQLAECFVQSAVYGAAEGMEMLPKARMAALQAVAIDESEAGAHMTLARVAGELDFDWNEALRRCRLALACDRIAPATRALAAQFTLWPLGRIDELNAAIAPALTADPLSPMPRIVMAQGLAARGEHERALREIDGVLEMHENFWPGHLGRSFLLTLTERTSDAIAALEKGLAIATWNAAFAGMLAGHYTRAGEFARADALLAGLDEQPSSTLAALARGAFHYVCREYERAAEEYDVVLDRRYPVGAYYLTWLCLSARFRESAPGRRLLARTQLRAG